jgi:hypothetical protein
MSQPIRCRCGGLRGEVDVTRNAVRAVCYCRDCQAYARALGAADVIDSEGGTEVVASLPQNVRFTQGVDRLACLSLSPNGLLRWYASCCTTPIGNTPRNPKVPYVGLVRTCLASDATALDEAFGPVRVRVNTASARGPVHATPMRTLGAVVRLATSAAAARLSGRWRCNPFFLTGTSTPVREVRVVSKEERTRAYAIFEA